MNKKNTLILTLSLVVLIIGSTVAYKALSKKYKESSTDSINQSEITASEAGEATISPAATQVLTATPTPTAVPAESNKAEDFTVETYSGSSISLSDYFGKPIVINFWASWCGPCKAEMPAFNNVYNDLKNDVVFLMVDLVDGFRETKETGYNYITGQGFNFPVYYDMNQDAAYNYSVNSVPTTYFIDVNGNISSFHKGAMSESKLRGEIDKILN